MLELQYTGKLLANCLGSLVCFGVSQGRQRTPEGYEEALRHLDSSSSSARWETFLGPYPYFIYFSSTRRRGKAVEGESNYFWGTSLL